MSFLSSTSLLSMRVLKTLQDEVFSNCNSNIYVQYSSATTWDEGGLICTEEGISKYYAERLHLTNRQLVCLASDSHLARFLHISVQLFLSAIIDQSL